MTFLGSLFCEDNFWFFGSSELLEALFLFSLLIQESLIQIICSFEEEKEEDTILYDKKTPTIKDICKSKDIKKEFVCLI